MVGLIRVWLIAVLLTPLVFQTSLCLRSDSIRLWLRVVCSRPKVQSGGCRSSQAVGAAQRDRGHSEVQGWSCEAWTARRSRLAPGLERGLPVISPLSHQFSHQFISSVWSSFHQASFHQSSVTHH
jgi:hypothetical protein